MGEADDEILLSNLREMGESAILNLREIGDFAILNLRENKKCFIFASEIALLNYGKESL